MRAAISSKTKYNMRNQDQKVGRFKMARRLAFGDFEAGIWGGGFTAGVVLVAPLIECRTIVL